MPELLEKIWKASEFLNFERKEPLKHELLANEFYPMACASFTHSLIVSNQQYLLKQQFWRLGFIALQGDIRGAE